MIIPNKDQFSAKNVVSHKYNLLFEFKYRSVNGHVTVNGKVKRKMIRQYSLSIYNTKNRKLVRTLQLPNIYAEMIIKFFDYQEYDDNSIGHKFHILYPLVEDFLAEKIIKIPLFMSKSKSGESSDKFIHNVVIDLKSFVVFFTKEYFLNLENYDSEYDPEDAYEDSEASDQCSDDSGFSQENVRDEGTEVEN